MAEANRAGAILLCIVHCYKFSNRLSKNVDLTRAAA